MFFAAVFKLSFEGSISSVANVQCEELSLLLTVSSLSTARLSKLFAHRSAPKALDSLSTSTV